MNRLRAERLQSNRLRASRLILGAVVVVAAAAVWGFAGLTPSITIGSAAAAPGTATLPVTSALIACPAPGTGSLTGGSLALASSGQVPGTGQAMLTQLSPGGGTGAGSSAGTTVKVLTAPGQQLISKIPKAPKVPASLAPVTNAAGGKIPTSVTSGGLIISAVGALAQGLDAEQLSPEGLPTGRCLAPGSDFWFVTPGSSKLHSSLYLLNTDSQPADVSVDIQTDAGPTVGQGDSGIVVPPYSMVTQDLTKSLLAAHATSLHVTTSSGRVVAGLRQTKDTTVAGAWVPAAGPPATSQILPGMAGNSGTPELYLSVPGAQPAQVQVTAITTRGTYQPTGGSGISLLSHTATSVALPSLSGVPSAIKVTSNVPVVAELLLSGGPAGAPGAFLTATDPIATQAILAASPVGTAGTTELVLSAPKAAATVSVTQAVAGQSLTGQSAQTVNVPAHGTKTLYLRLSKHQSSATTIVVAVVPQPGSGPVYAARLALVNGALDSVIPLISTPSSVTLPPVRESLVEILK